MGEGKCNMKRSIVFAAVMVVLISSGISLAKEKAPADMPKKVRAYLDSLVGIWDVDSELLKGWLTMEWDPGQDYLIGRFQGTREGDPYSDCGFWHWDGVSKDGFMMSLVGPDVHSISHCKVTSRTSAEGKEAGVLAGRKFSNVFRMESKDRDSLTYTATQSLLGGEEQPDFVAEISRVKPLTRKDFKEWCRLNSGRWMGDVTLVADIPGMGKKGETLTSYYEAATAQDGNVLIEKFYAGEGSSMGMSLFDGRINRIRTMWITSSGVLNYGTTWKVGDKWVGTDVGCNPDGTKIVSTGVLTFSEDGKTATAIGSSLIDGEKTDEWNNTWRKLTK